MREGSGHERAVLIAAVLGSSMVFLDGTTVNVALPALQEKLGASLRDVQWVVNAYTLFLSALLLIGGSFGDHLGRKRIFVVGVTIFTGASIWCGLAPDVSHLITARALQGVGGALLTPGSLALINASFPESRRGAAIGQWSAYSAIATAAGPILGGWLIDSLSWRWIFFANVPLAVVAIVVALTRVPESRPISEEAGLDYLGAALATLGLGGVAYGLLEAPSPGGAGALALGAGAVGVLLLALFVAWEARAPSPMVPLELFRSEAFSGINLVTLLVYANLAALTFFLPMYLIQVRGYSATAAGAATLPMVALLLLASSWAGELYDRVGPRLPIGVGSLITALAFGAFVFLGEAGNYLIAVTLPMTIMGAGMALIVAPLTTTVMASVRDELAGTASGINNAVSRVAGLVAIGVFGIVMLSLFTSGLERELSASPLSEQQRHELLAQVGDLAAAPLPKGLSEAEANAAQGAVAASFTRGFHLVLWVLAGVALAAATISALTLPGEGERPRPLSR